MPVRVRFAPSPTGPLHIGGIRTALYNYLFARSNGGQFIIRIEDTDQNRLVPGAEEYILETLKWCGIQNHEGPNIHGSYGPYRQSERKDIYRQYAELLVTKGDAYYAFDTQEELELMRDQLKKEGSNTLQYDVQTRSRMKNSLTLPKPEVNSRIERGDAYVIRVKIPADEEVKFNDLIRGNVNVHSNQIDDKVIFKSDGWPTYHLANIVDDYLMKITHVIRGEEWLPSTPLHFLLYKFLGWKNVRPQFAHVPLILRPDGNGKLSKRDGDRLGFPVFALNWKDTVSGELSHGFRERGFFPDAFVNMLALLGWNPGTEDEIMSMNDMIVKFSLDHVHKAGAKFDFEKAKWFNHEYMKRKSGVELAVYLNPKLEEQKIKADPDYVARVCDVLKNRCTFITDLWDNGYFFFNVPTSYDPGVVQNKWNDSARKTFKLLNTELKNISDFEMQSVEAFLHDFLQQNKLKAGEVLPLLRVMLIGTKNGPAAFEIISLLGKEEVLSRIESAMQVFDRQKANA